MGFNIKKAAKKIVDYGSDGVDYISDQVPENVQDIFENLDSGVPIIGTPGDDTIIGTDRSDTILADPTVMDDVGGDDFVRGRKGDDVIHTFGGDDEVYGDIGDDTISTADGDDYIEGGTGDDDVQSGRGEDIVHGGRGNDDLRGGEGDDELYGGRGNDRIIGGSDNDTLTDGEGQDQLEGRTGADLIYLVEDGETDTVVFLAEDQGTGTDTVTGFSIAAPDEGGDLIDPSNTTAEQIFGVQLYDDVLFFFTDSEPLDGVPLALVENVGIGDLLDDNVVTPEGTPLVTIPLEDPDLAQAIAESLASADKDPNGEGGSIPGTSIGELLIDLLPDANDGMGIAGQDATLIA